MINLISLQTLRTYCPVSNITDDALIAAAINHAQVTLVPSIFGLSFYKDLLQKVQDQDYPPVLDFLAPVISCFAASNLSVLTANLIFPTKLQSQGSHDPSSLSSYYTSLVSSYLQLLYDYCDSNHISYNKFRSTSLCSINLSGSYGRSCS